MTLLLQKLLTMMLLTPAVENHHIDPTEEPELIANTFSDAPKKPVSVYYFKPLAKATQCEKKSKKVSSSILTSTPIKNVKTKGKSEGIAENFKKTEKRSSPKSIKSWPNSPVASVSKDGVIRCPACEEEYCDPPTEEWTHCCKYQKWWHEECSN
ncbi:UNVERIFIED_CONTAM: hypothetical protein NCL1_49330 [Trichonephila clavipes]